MKKYCVLVILIFAFVTLTACGSRLESPPKSSEAIVYVNEQHSFSLTFPETWENKYFIEEQDEIVSVYHEGTWVEQKTGKLFDIYIFSREKWDSEGIELADIIGLRVINENDEVVFALGRPTDVQTSLNNNDLRDEYHNMENDVNEIINTFRITN